ncbi:MAG TPA: ELWxxDGT repeat protein [Kamptonema sp.]|nr:ELWxxDGT repeat protein [Kamptonema sp.]
MNKQIIFVDSSVQDYQSLIKDIDRAEIIILNNNFSAIDRITKVLADRKDIESIHIISHGSSGNLKLGSDTLNNQTLDEFSDRIKQWGKALTENGDILLYGCDVGAQQTGLQFVQKLHQLTGADIAASDDKTGNQALDGDWDLEVKTGNIETSLAVSSQAQSTYNDILGIQVVKDINPGSANSFPSSLTIANNTLLFNADDGVNGIELWKTDGTTGGTMLVFDIYGGTSNFGNPQKFTGVNGTTFLVAFDGNGVELWKTDGTGGGTVLVKDIYPFSNSSNPFYLTNLNNTLYFMADDGINGQELWKSDGTAGGTVLVKDIVPGVVGSSPSYLTNVNGTLYFMAYDTNGGELWKSDGTAAGTVFVKDINPGSNSSSISSFHNFNGTAFFTAYDGTNGVELWKTDGTTAGTVMVKDINPGSGSGTGYSKFANVNGTMYFNADDGINGDELWKSDGTTAGTVLVKDINPGINQSSISELTNVNGTLYFKANDGTNGYELWKSDGTTVGTKLVKDFIPGAGSADPTNLINFNNSLYFRANTPTQGYELVKLTPSSVTAVSATTANGAYGVGQTVNITVTFNEPVTVDTTGGTPRLQLATGTINQYATYTSGSGTDTLTFNYVVQADDVSTDLEYLATNSLELNGGTITADGIDTILTLPALGSAQSLGGSKNLVIDTIVPTVSGISSTTPDGAYTVGQVIPITAQFNEVVNVTGTPQFTLDIGGVGRILNYTSGSGSNTLTFNYTVAAGDTAADLDYLSTTALALNGGAIKDSASNDATLTLPAPGAANSLGANKALVIDAVIPTISNITSTTPDGTYTVGQVIPITTQFSEVVTVTGTPQLTLATGGAGTVLNYAGGSNSNTLTFNYTVATGDASADLDYLSTSALALNGGAIADSANNNANLTLPSPGATNSLGANKALVIDAVIPTITNITSTTSDGTYTVGQVIPITAQFSEAVNVTGTPQLTLATGGAGTALNYASGSGSNALTFNYTVATGDASADLDYLSTTALALNGGAIADSANNNANLTLPSPGAANSLSANKGLVIDAVIPTITNITSTIANGSYTVGQAIPITVQFNEAVNVTGTPQLTLATGGAGTALNYASGSGTNTLTFNYTVAAGDTSTDLDYLSTSALALNGGAIADTAGNNATLTLPTPAGANSLAANKNIAIDTTPLTVTINQDPGQPDPTAGSTINFAAVFSKPVTGFDSSDITIGGTAGATGATVTQVGGTGTLYNIAVTGMSAIGTVTATINAGGATDVAGNSNTASSSTDNQVSYDNTSPTSTGINRVNPDINNSPTVNYTASFSENVTGVDTSDFTLATTGGVTGASIVSVTPVSGSSYTVNINTGSGDGTLQLNLTDNDSIQNTLLVPIGGAGVNNGSATGQIYTLDKTVPTLSNVTSTNADGTYGIGQVIAFPLTFSEVVQVTGTPKLNLNNGGFATYAAGNNTNALTFNYTVAAGESTADLDYASTTALDLNSGTIKDLATNDANLTLAAPGAAGSVGASKDILIDATAATITNITSTLADGNYTIGQVVPIAVTFDESVNVTGTPNLTLNNGGTATYASGSGTNTLTFNYIVAAGQNTTDLDQASVSALSLNSGTIKDVANNDATLTVPAPGAANSLGGNKNIAIDTTDPTISNITSTLADGSYTTGQVIPISITLSENVNVTGTPKLALNSGIQATYVSGSGTNTLTFDYTVAAGQNIADLDYANALALSLNGGTIKDAFNNNATLNLPTPGAANSLGANKNITIDTTAPAIAGVNSTLANGNYTVGQTVPIDLSFNEIVNVTGVPKLTLNTGGIANYASGSGTNTLTFNHTVASGQNTTDLDYQNATALTLNGGTIQDKASNNAIINLAAPGAVNSLGANKNIAIDTIVPTISSVTSTLPNGNYPSGQVIPLTVAFSENVNVTGTPAIALNNGGIATYASGSGGNPLTFNYTVGAGQNTADLDYANANALSLNGGTINDASTNNATLTLPNPGATNSLGANKAIAIDATVPAISNVTATISDGNYTLGQVVPIAIAFNESVKVTGTPTLALNNGGIASYAYGSNTNTLTFNYTIGAGQNTADLDYASANALSLNSGTIQDTVGNNAVLTLPNPGAAASLGANKAIVINTTAPTITNVTSPAADASLVPGQVIAIDVFFSKNVNVTGTPKLALNSGGTADYVGGSGTNTLRFNYTIAAGQKTPDLDYASANALSLNGGKIEDVFNNNANLNLPAPGTPNSLGANKNLSLFDVVLTEPDPTTISGREFTTWNQLETYLNQFYPTGIISSQTKQAIKSVFNIFESGESDPENTVTAIGNFENDKLELAAKRNEVRLDLATILDTVKEFSPFYTIPLTIPASLSDYNVSLPLKDTTLAITQLKAAPIYELSAKALLPDDIRYNYFLKAFKDFLELKEIKLKGEVYSALNSPSAYLTGTVSLDKTIFKANDFELALLGGDVFVGIEKGDLEEGTLIKPTVGYRSQLRLRNYDPFQTGEPDLIYTGLLTLDPTSLTGGFKLAAKEGEKQAVWKNPFGIPDTEIRNLGFEVGGTYKTPYIDNFKVIGDLKFGNYDFSTVFAINIDAPNNNAVLLTTNKPVRLLDVFIDSTSVVPYVSSYILKQIAERVKPVQDGLNFLNKIIDLKVSSFDSDNDGDLDPLIKFVPTATTIGGDTYQPGLSINAKLSAWGKEATLVVEGNPFNLNPNFSGALKLPTIDWGFLKLNGFDQPNMDLKFDINSQRQSFEGNGSLDIFGKNIGSVKFNIENVSQNLPGSFNLGNLNPLQYKTQVNIDKFNWNLGVVGLELNSLKFNPQQFTGSGSGKVKLFGQEIAKGSFALNNGNLSAAGRLGVNVLGQDFGVNVQIGLGLNGNRIRLDTSAFGKNVNLVDLSLDPFVNKFKSIGDITSIIEGLFRDQILAGFNSVKNAVFSIFDGYIANSTVFFDGNFNGLLDADEPFTISNPDGSFDLIPELEKFDKNQDGKIDYTEGKYVASGGTDISTSLQMATPLTSTPESKVVTPLMTILTELGQQGIEPKTGQTQILAALGLPTTVDLASYDPLSAIANGDANGVAVFAALIMVQNTIVQTAKFIDGVSEMPLEQLASGPIAAIANQLKGGTPVDLGKIETILAILQDAISKAAQTEPTINPSQLAAAAAAAAQIVALGNQIVKDLVASGRPIKDIALEITKLQAVSVGQIAVGLPELAAGVVTVEQFLAQNTKEAILSRVAKAQVNDPTFRPSRETVASENALVPLELNSDNTNPVTQIDSSASTAIEINTPKISLIDRGDRTNLPQNQMVDGNYLLTDGDDNEIPLAAFSQPIFGLSGNDYLIGSNNNDTIQGNKGADTIDGGNGDDNLFGGKHSDQLSGGSGDDFLSGNNENDTLTGGDGNDRIRGGKENDVLIGGKGDDELWGDKGFDVLTGGAGKDNFVLEFTTSNPAFADVIFDFTSEDKIKLVGANFSQLTFESVNVIFDGATAVASTAIKSGNNYLGVVYNVNSTALNSSSFF